MPPDMLVVLPDFNGGGAERVALTLVNGLTRRGRRVELSVFRRTGSLEMLLDHSVRVHDLRAGRLRSVAFRLLATLRETRPRIVFSTLGHVNLALLIMKPLLPSGMRLWIREANLPSISLANNKFTRPMRLGYRLLYPRADVVICSSDRMRTEFADHFGVEESRIRTLPNPVDESAIRESAVVPERIAGEGVRFVASGRLTRQKGFDRLLEMFAELRDPNSRLSILGEGPLEADLTTQAHRLGISGQVSFLGFISNPWAVVAGADAFLLPSRWEGMPNVALEALACGVPVIATPESGGVAEVAAAAPPGAVTVVDVGEPFLGVMRRTVPDRPRCLRRSLLPPQYCLESVVDSFEKWIGEYG